MLSLGAVVAIDHWATRMAEAHPDYCELWVEIKDRASRIDFVGLRALAARLETDDANDG